MARLSGSVSDTWHSPLFSSAVRFAAYSPRFFFSASIFSAKFLTREPLVAHSSARSISSHVGPMVAADLRKRRPKPHTIWHLDEVYLKIDGRMVYLWRAVEEG